MAISTSYSEITFRDNCEYGTIIISVPSAEIYTLNSIPYLFISAPAAGRVILALHAEAGMQVGSPYTTNTTLQIITDTATIAQLECPGALLATTTWAMRKFDQISAPLAANTQVVQTKGLYLKVATGNPGGVSTDVLIVKVSYKIARMIQ